MKNAYRIFLALFYLAGTVIHFYLGIWLPDVYNNFSQSTIFPPFQWLWLNLVIPNITLFALLLVGFEGIVFLLLINKGKWVKLGVALSLIFNGFLVFLGLASPAETPWLDFVRNRLALVIFIFLQLPLLWIPFEKTLSESITGKPRTIR